ncbi:MAG: type II secretion system GspH family protein [bacterium]|nr:type II secretion system GspH family protein [bacterium]
MKKRPSCNSKNGFTLVELLVVMAIIGILAAVLLSNFVGIRERAADTSYKNDMRQLKTALRIYYNDFQRYPDSSGGVIQGCTDGTAACAGSFSANGTSYMNELPVGVGYYSDGGEGFLLTVPLTNASDADIVASQTRCDVANRSYYTAVVTDLDYFVCED